MAKKKIDENIGRSGYIYIMTNPSIPDYVKIGYAGDVEERRNQLNAQTACPRSFYVYATYKVNKYAGDLILHDLIDLVNEERRIREFDKETKRMREREFFELSAEDACQILENIAEMSGTKDERFKRIVPNREQERDSAAAEANRKKQNARRENFSFVKCGILVGEEVELVGHPEIKATVHSDKEIEYNGHVGSLSGFASELLEIDHTLQGPIYWTYKGVLLNEIREDREAKGLYK